MVVKLLINQEETMEQIQKFSDTYELMLNLQEKGFYFSIKQHCI